METTDQPSNVKPSTSKASVVLEQKGNDNDKPPTIGKQTENKIRRRARGGGDQRRKPKIKMQPSNMEDPGTRLFNKMKQDVRNGIQSCESGKELEVLHRALRPEHHALWYKCIEVKKDLLTALAPYYPQVRLEVFGSTVMGIAFKDSDFDFYIEVSPNPLEVQPAKVIREAMKILSQSGNFTYFTPITRARIPILKCFHIKTGYHCDLNFSESLGVLNSPILAHLISFDPRIYVLATIIKYWMKVHDCSGTNRITNYAVMWMIMFYLQTLPLPILPPIIEFQKRVQPYLVHDLNFAFDFQLPNKTQNHQRFSELLLGFFKFYKEFDYDKKLLCPLYGRAFDKADVEAKRLPQFNRYEELLKRYPNNIPMKLKTGLSIQDPFDITRALPGAISEYTFLSIIKKIEHAADIVEQELKNSGESAQLLLKIFDPVEFNRFVEQKLSKQKNIDSTIPKIERLKNAVTTISFTPTDPELSIVRDILSKSSNDPKTIIDKVAIKTFWAENVIKFFIQIFQQIFMFELKCPLKNGDETNATATDVEQLTSKESDKFLKLFDIVGARDVFCGRKQIKNVTDKSLLNEMADSIKRFENNIKINLNVAVKITADLESFNNVSIEFKDLIKKRKNNNYKMFCSTFEQHSRLFLKVFFIHKQSLCIIGDNVRKLIATDNTENTSNGNDDGCENNQKTANGQ